MDEAEVGYELKWGALAFLSLTDDRHSLRLEVKVGFIKEKAHQFAFDQGLCCLNSIIFVLYQWVLAQD